MSLDLQAREDGGVLEVRAVTLLAETLQLRARELKLVSGEAAREKRILIRGFTADELRARLAPHLPT